MPLLAPIKTLNRMLYFGFAESRTGFFPGLSYHCRLLPYRVTGHRPLATGHGALLLHHVTTELPAKTVR